MEQSNAQFGQEASAGTKQPEEPQAQATETQASMESLLQEEGLGLDFPQQGEIRQGVIASIGENEILVSIGTKSEGVIPARELDHLDPEKRATLRVGKQIPVYVVNPEDPNGSVQLSMVRAFEETDWKNAESLLGTGETFSADIIGYNKGGLIVPMGQLRGFVPASQVSVLRRADASGGTPEQRWGAMVGQPITVTVVEVDRDRRRLILSERAALQETRETLKERLLDELHEGDVRTGRVTSLADFGAFVNIDGADGLVHLSEISWERIGHPREALKVGQEVKVKVIGVDRERKRIGLSIRQLQDDPWVQKIQHIKEGQLVEGTITHLTKFGAFARLDEETEGLIHISELSEQRVNHPKEVVHEGDVLTLRVIRIEPERHRIALSLRKVDSPAYADLDWKTTLAGVVEETHEHEGVQEKPEVDEVEESSQAFQEQGLVQEVEEETVDVEAVDVEDLKEAVEEVVAAEDVEVVAEEEEVLEAVDVEDLKEAVEEVVAAEDEEVVAEEEEVLEAVEAVEAVEEVEAVEAVEEVEAVEAVEAVEEVEAVEAEEDDFSDAGDEEESDAGIADYDEEESDDEQD